MTSRLTPDGVRPRALRAGGLLGLVSCTLPLLGCVSEVSWSNHVSFRSHGKGVQLSHVDQDAVVLGRIRRNLHYVSIALDSVFFRDLPGFTGRSVVFGFELRGAGPKPIKTVLDVIESAGEHSFLALDNALVMQPFLYGGQNIEMTLWFRATSKDSANNIKGRLSGAGDVLKRLNPLARDALDVASSLFEGVIGAFVQREQSWKYTFTLHPFDSTFRDKPDLLFTAGRHILMSSPPAGAPSPYRVLRPAKLIQYLGMRGNRLMWRHNDEEFTELPYIILNITRYKRYPRPDTPLREAVDTAEKFYAQDNLERARAAIKNVGSAILDDRVITQREKNLEQLWNEYREARIDTATAQKSSDTPKVLEGMLAQIKFLGEILANFAEILEPFEVKDIDFRISRLAAAYRRLSEPSAQEGLAKLLEQQKAAIDKARTDARDEEALRQKLLAKYDGPVAESRPPPDVLDARARLRRAAVKPWREWWFWSAVAVAAGGAGVGGFYALRNANQVAPTTPRGPSLPGAPGAP